MTDPATPTKPIVVAQDATPKAVLTAAQYAAASLAAYAVGKGWIGADLAGQIAGFVLALVPAAYGIYKTIVSNREKVIMEPYAPDSVAVAAK